MVNKNVISFAVGSRSKKTLNQVIKTVTLSNPKTIYTDGLNLYKFLIHKTSGLPDTRRMAKIGSFWIFAASNQHEIHTTKNFVEAGDLISTNTILFNYKFFHLDP